MVIAIDWSYRMTTHPCNAAFSWGLEVGAAHQQSQRVTFDPDWLHTIAGRPELLTPEEMARADAAAPALGVPGKVLMANAGRAVARSVQARFRPCRTLVLAGPGNNGGDGYMAARLLQQEGWPVSLAALAPPRAGSDAAEAAMHWRGPSAQFAPAEAARCELVIDAVFGAGLARDVDGVVADTLRAARQVVAVDVPSGLDGATGGVRGYAPVAALTVTFFRLKPGHLLLPGREICGEIVLADIGLPDAVLQQIHPGTCANLPELWRLPTPGLQSHKYSRGHVTVVGGTTMTGAARLAADAARHGGAGLVTIAAAGRGDIYRTGAPGVLVSDAPLADLLQDKRRHVWVCGPGLGPDAARATLPVLLSAGRCVVADADVFSAFAGDPEALRGAAVLTPHAAEFARAFGAPGADRVAAARAAAARTGGVVLLKGADTIIAAPDGRVAINASAPPWLATAGSGDVLAGLIAGLLAQGMVPWDAAAAAAYLHGRAAVLAGPGLVAEDLLPALTRALVATTGQPHLLRRRV
jgi:ADP-dependent NAD(P)H-hydrate dehydratase / NAD(P)H-hydrate epimerase